MPFSATANLMRRLNRSAVLDLLRNTGPLSRAQMARCLHMSLPTVARIVEELQAEGLVRSEGRSGGGIGRPGALLAFNGDAYAVLGVDLGGTHMYGTVADLSGRIQHEAHLRPEEGPADAVERLCSLIERLLQAPRPSTQRVRGIGIGAPGTVLSDGGFVLYAPSLNWRDLPLKALLQARFGLPILVENDVNLMALGEMGFGAGRGLRDLVCITVGTGVGSGIIAGGALCRGHHQAAGEVGYLVPGVEHLGRPCAGFGEMESLASCSALVERARRALEVAGQMPARRRAAGHAAALTVFAAARRGEGWAAQAVAETADYLSLVVAAVHALLDPEAIILGGEALAGADLLLPHIEERLRGMTLRPLRLLPSQLGYRAAVLGAIMLVLDATTEHVVVEKRS
jgi:glucokinase-like ROK family protein